MQMSHFHHYGIFLLSSVSCDKRNTHLEPGQVGKSFYDKAINQSERNTKMFLSRFKHGQASIVLLQPVSFVITAKIARKK